MKVVVENTKGVVPIGGRGENFTLEGVSSDNAVRDYGNSEDVPRSQMVG